MKQLLFVFLLTTPSVFFAQNPFSFVGKTKTDIDAQIGKPVARDQKDGTTEVWAYPFSASGDYHIKYVQDTARAFTYKPKIATTFSLSDIPYTLKEAQRQPDDANLLVSETEKPKIQVYLKEGKIKKVVYLR